MFLAVRGCLDVVVALVFLASRQGFVTKSFETPLRQNFIIAKSSRAGLDQVFCRVLWNGNRGCTEIVDCDELCAVYIVIL